jgi:hypothetical protein
VNAFGNVVQAEWSSRSEVERECVGSQDLAGGVGLSGTGNALNPLSVWSPRDCGRTEREREREREKG